MAGTGCGGPQFQVGYTAGPCIMGRANGCSQWKRGLGWVGVALVTGPGVGLGAIEVLLLPCVPQGLPNTAESPNMLPTGRHPQAPLPALPVAHPTPHQGSEQQDQPRRLWGARNSRERCLRGTVGQLTFIH